MAPGEPQSEGVDLGIPGYADAVEIGRGGFAVVYRARRLAFDQLVAVKVLALARDDIDVDRFDRERRAMGALAAHPNIVTVYESGLTGGGHAYLCMEYLERGSAADRLASAGPLRWQSAVRIGVRLAGALETAHRAGVLHRDIKPENVLMSNFGEPQLADFGIARITGAGETRSGAVSATLAYAPPEILAGHRPSVRSDVYSLGATLFTLLSGRYPFADETGEQSLARLMVRIDTEAVPDLRALGVPDGVCLALEQSMAKDPAQRQGSAQELGAELQRAQLLADEAATALPIGPVHSEVIEARVSAPGRPRRRALKTVVAAVAFIALAVAAVVYGPFDRGDSLEPPTSAGSLPTSSTPTTVSPAPTVASTIKVDNAISAVVGLGSVWVLGFKVVHRIDPGSGSMRASIPIEAPASGMAVGENAVWLIINRPELPGLLLRIDPSTNQIAGRMPIGMYPNGVAVGSGSVWVSEAENVERVDVRMSQIVARIPIQESLNSIAVGEGAVWAESGEKGNPGVARIDVGTNKVTARVAVGNRSSGPSGAYVQIATGGGLVWVLNRIDKAIFVLDPSTGALVRTIDLGRLTPHAITFARGSLWLADYEGRSAVRVSTGSSPEIQMVSILGSGSDISADGDDIWVVSFDANGNSLVRIGP